MNEWQTICLTTGETVYKSLSSVWEYSQTIPTGYWVTLGALAGISVGYAFTIATSARGKKGYPRNFWKERLKRVKKRISSRLVNGTHRQKSPIPDDVLKEEKAPTPIKVSSLVQRLKKSKTKDKYLHNL